MAFFNCKGKNAEKMIGKKEKENSKTKKSFFL